MTPTTRNGKIAHLPRPLRDELCQRLDNGVPGHELLAWLNADPEVQRILGHYYPGRRITQQNLSEWRQGGYQEWFKLQQTNQLTLQLAKEPGPPDTASNPRKIIDAMTTITTAEFIRTAEERLHECRDTKERWQHVCEVSDRLSRLRRDNHRDLRHSLQQRASRSELGSPQAKIKLKTAHFPSGTDRNQAQKIFTSARPAPTPMDATTQNSRSPQPAAPCSTRPQTKDHPASGIRHQASIPMLSLTLAHPASRYDLRPPVSGPHQGKIKVETAHFPSGTNPNQPQKKSPLSTQ